MDSICLTGSDSLENAASTDSGITLYWIETGICTKTLSCVFVSTFTSNCCTFMLMRRTTASIKGVFQLSPGPATRANLPRRCTMATCAVSTVKNEPKTTLKAKINKKNPRNETIMPVGLIFALPSRSRQIPNERQPRCLGREVLEDCGVGGCPCQIFGTSDGGNLTR